MKNLRKLLLVITTIAIAVTSLVGLTACGGEGDSKKDKNTLYVATNAAFPPFEYLNEGEIVGFDIDIIKAIALEMGYKHVKFNNMNFDKVEKSVKSGESDVAIAALTIDDSKDVEFSDSYFDTAQVVIYKGESKTFKSLVELKQFINGKKVGVCEGYSGDNLLFNLKTLKEVSPSQTIYAKGPAGDVDKAPEVAIQKLANGEVDVVILDKEAAISIINSNTAYADIKIASQALKIEDYGIACKVGDTDMLEKVNKAIKAIKTKDESGKSIYDKIVERYF